MHWLIGSHSDIRRPYTPKQNRIADRDHRSTFESARSQIHDRGVPLSLWAEAVNYSVYVLNRTLSKTHSKTPFERWHGVVPDISNLRIFGSVAYMFIPNALVKNSTRKPQKESMSERARNKRRVAYLLLRPAALISRDMLKFTKIYHTGLRLRSNLHLHLSLKQQPPPLINLDSPEKGVPPPTAPLCVEEQLLERQVSVPIRKSIRGLIPKKLFPIETFGSYAFTQSSKMPMSCCISIALKGFSLYYEPQT